MAGRSGSVPAPLRGLPSSSGPLIPPHFQTSRQSCAARDRPTSRVREPGGIPGRALRREGGATSPSAARNHATERSFRETIHIYRDTRVRLLSQVSTATSLAVVVPVPLDASTAARIGVHLREAIRKVNNGEYGDAAT